MTRAVHATAAPSPHLERRAARREAPCRAAVASGQARGRGTRRPPRGAAGAWRFRSSRGARCAAEAQTDGRALRGPSDGTQRALRGHSEALRWPSDRNQTQSDGPRIAIRRNQRSPSHLSELSRGLIWQDLVQLTTRIGPLGGQGHPCTFVTPAAERCSERKREGEAGASLEDSGGLYR